MAKAKTTEALTKDVAATPAGPACPACRNTSWRGPRYVSARKDVILTPKRPTSFARSVVHVPAHLEWACETCGYTRHEPCTLLD